MPVIDIKALPQASEPDVQAMLVELCEGVAAVMGIAPHTVWATWQELRPGMYVEGGNAQDAQPVATHPPIARFISFAGKSDEQIEAALNKAAEVIAGGLGMEPGNVFVVYDEAQPGRVFTGGAVRR